MNIERLEEFTRDYLTQMQSRVMMNASGKMNEDLVIQYKQMVEDFINIHPGVLEKYRESFEFYPMRSEFEASSENIVNKIAEKIFIVKRALENDQDIEKVEKKTTETEKEHNYSRTLTIQETIQDQFRYVEGQMRKREFNVNFENLRIYCNRIISKYTESIEENVFENNEQDIIKQEVQKYMDEIKMMINNEKSQETKLQWKEGTVCPIISDTSEFARINKQIADRIKEENEKTERETLMYDENALSGDVIE